MSCLFFAPGFLISESLFWFNHTYGVGVGTTTSVVGDGGIRVGTGVSVGMVTVGEGGTNVTVAGMVVGTIKVAVAVAVNVAVGVIVAVLLAGIENSTCSSGAPAASPSNDLATRWPDVPVTTKTREFPEIQLG